MKWKCSVCNKVFPNEDAFDGHKCYTMATGVARRMFAKGKNPTFQEFVEEFNKEQKKGSRK